MFEKRLETYDIISPPVSHRFAREYAPVVLCFFDWKHRHSAIMQENGILIIGLNRNDSFEERRFTLFPEISHFLLEKERQLFGQLPLHHKGQEYRADQGAREILMPSRWVREVWKSAPWEKELSQLFKVPLSCLRARTAGEGAGFAGIE